MTLRVAGAGTLKMGRPVAVVHRAGAGTEKVRESLDTDIGSLGGTMLTRRPRGILTVRDDAGTMNVARRDTIDDRTAAGTRYMRVRVGTSTCGSLKGLIRATPVCVLVVLTCMRARPVCPLKSCMRATPASVWVTLPD